MCLILLAHQTIPARPLLMLANRDEYFARPTAAAAPWDEKPTLLAGRDLQAGGTWMGVCADGRWAALTNVRQGTRHGRHERSRGWLVRDYLLGECDPEEYLRQVTTAREAYAGFNLLAGDREQLWYFSNRGGLPCRLPPGIYGLSNHLLDTPWPKVVAGKQGLAALPEDATQLHEAAFRLLGDRRTAPDHLLPDTGVPLEWERALSAAFIITPDYGTRCSTLLSASSDDELCLTERNFNSNPDGWHESRYRLIAGNSFEIA